MGDEEAGVETGVLTALVLELEEELPEVVDLPLLRSWQMLSETVEDSV